MTEWKISGHARQTSHCFHWKMLVYVSYSKYKIFGLCTGDCSLFIFVIYQKGLDRRERRLHLNSQSTRWVWRYVSEGCNSLLIGFIQTNCSWSGVRGGLGWILPPEGGWALSRLPLAVVTTPNCQSSRSVWMTLFRHTVGFWGLSCAGPGADSMISVSLSQFRGFCDSVTQVLINARRVCFTAQAGALRHSCPVCLHSQMKEIHPQVGPQSQHCWDMNPLSSGIKREQIPLPPFAQDLTTGCCMLQAKQTRHWPGIPGGVCCRRFPQEVVVGGKVQQTHPMVYFEKQNSPWRNRMGILWH